MSYQFSLKIRSGFQARIPPFSNASVGSCGFFEGRMEERIDWV